MQKCPCLGPFGRLNWMICGLFDAREEWCLIFGNIFDIQTIEKINVVFWNFCLQSPLYVLTFWRRKTLVALPGSRSTCRLKHCSRTSQFNCPWYWFQILSILNLLQNWIQKCTLQNTLFKTFFFVLVFFGWSLPSGKSLHLLI